MKQKCIYQLYLICFISFSGNAYSQYFNEPLVFINFQRSFSSNFLTGEFQIGNRDETNFINVRAGVNFTSYHSFEHCPYYLTIPEPRSIYEFYDYQSKRRGINAGIGGLHYFKSLSNLQEFIPYLGLQGNWYMDNDYYSIQFKNTVTSDKNGYSDQKTFHTISADLQAGVIFIYKKLIFNGSFLLSYFLPVNNHYYLATDSYNPRSSTKLPFAGFEPAAQLGIGFKL